MRTESGAVVPFPYVKHAAEPQFDLRQTFLYSLLSVPMGVAFLWFAKDRYVDWTTGAADHFGTGTMVAFGALGSLFVGAPIAMILHLGADELFPDRVSIRTGATVIRPQIVSLKGVLVALATALLATMGFGITFLDSVFTSGRRAATGLILGPALLALVAVGTLGYVWSLFRRIRMTPEHLEYRRGFRTICIPWDQMGDVITTNDVKDHSGSGHFSTAYRPGATIAVPEHLAESTSLPVWRDGGTPRLLLETGGFRVEASSLMTVILAMRDHPELRAELGTRTSRRFFFRPPFRVRRDMYRSQVWWPPGTAPEGVAVGTDGVVREHG